MDIFIRVDGQNFDSTIGDTDELSTLRGGSRALLDLPKAVFDFLEKNGYETMPVFTGASEGLAWVSVEDGRNEASLREAINKFRREFDTGDLGMVLPYLNFSFSIINPGNFGDDEKVIQSVCLNSNRIQQYQNFTVDLLGESDLGKSRPCALERKRPATKSFKKGDEELACSSSVHARHEYGHKLRQQFYDAELGISKADSEELKAIKTGWKEGDYIIFPDSFEEIIKPSPPLISDKLANKMAVLYMDGNQFGSIRGQADGTMDGQRNFSTHLKRKRCELLARILESIKSSAMNFGGGVKAPIETLLWGGDELMMVFPAWSAMKILEDLEPWLDGDYWAIEQDGMKYPLHHAVGLVICNYKTPIRAVKALARELADSTKDLCSDDNQPLGRHNSYLQYQALLGADPPPDLGSFREQLYKTDDPRAFTLPFHKGLFKECLELIRRFKGYTSTYEGVPYGRLLELLHRAMGLGLLATDPDLVIYESWRNQATEELGRYQGGHSLLELERACTGFCESYPLMPLVHLIQLWEYVDPHQAAVK